MGGKVKLSELADEMGMQMDEYFQLVNKETGEIIYIMEDYRDARYKQVAIEFCEEHQLEYVE